jgi:GDP-L-fucose synthase|tara:strand:- start:707 stop:1636 length:930 start_codon:yes stop_codon:yes gene_type:complete
MDSNSKILVAGSTGMVGSAIIRKLKEEGYENIYSAPRSHFDLTRQDDVEKYFRVNQPEYVFLAAAKVGGIVANKKYTAEFIRDNLAIQTNVIDAAYRHGVKKLLFLGSSCIYPKYCAQPIKEEYLLTGALEPSNESYAIAKIAGIRMCQAYREQYGFNAISLMPTNLYGPNDNFDLETSHVLPALMRKCHEGKAEGKRMDVWGSGLVMREFLHVDDLADACLFLMNNYDDPEIVNVGTGKDLSINELVSIISDVVGFTGGFNWDDSKPNGTPRKVLNIDKIKSFGWNPKISLRDGIKQTYSWYKQSLVV